MTPKKSPAQIEKALMQRLLDAFRRDLFVTRHQIIVGFSGGNDSLALALLLKGIERAINADIVLAHVDHRIRPESAHDARRAKALAAEIGLPFELLRADDHPTKLHPGVGLEEAARRVRFELLASLIAEPYDAIALAHHANDQAETMLLHLLRGSGIDGLAGMRVKTELPFYWDDVLPAELEQPNNPPLEVGVVVGFDDDELEDEEDDWPDEGMFGPDDGTFTLWRPLLRETRSDLEVVVARSGLKPIVDPSNADLDIRRNAIRHKLIPVIAEIEPAYLDRFGDLAEIAASESDLVEMTAESFAQRAINEDGSLNTSGFVRMDNALARRVVRLWIANRIGDLPTFERVGAVVSLSRESLPEGLIEVGGGNVVGGQWGRLFCGRVEEITEVIALRAGLLLPPLGSARTSSIEGDTIHVSGSGGKAISASRTFNVSPEATLSLEIVDRKAVPPGERTPFSNRMRDHNIPVWMRDRVFGVAFEGVVHWVPYTRDSQGTRPLERVVPTYQRTITIETTVEE
jgi:tRNA(Ile)-lysidine synthetase-like protein